MASGRASVIQSPAKGSELLAGAARGLTGPASEPLGGKQKRPGETPRAETSPPLLLAHGIPWLPREQSAAQHPEAAGLRQGSRRGGEQVRPGV